MKKEIKYILYSVVFAFIWFFIFLPHLSDIITSSSPFIQFLIVNLGLVIFFQIFLKAFLTSTTLNIKVTLGIVLLILAIDTFQPDYHVTLTGDILPGAVFGPSAIDYQLGILAVGLGLKGIWVAGFVFLLAPAILLYLSYLLLKKDFLSKL